MIKRLAIHPRRAAASLALAVPAAAVLGLALPVSAADAAEASPPAEVTPEHHPLLDQPKDRSTTERWLRAPATIAELPFRLLGSGLSGTLDFVERGDLLARFQGLPAWLARHHLTVGDGGQGTGSGIGVLAGVFAPIGPGALSATTAWTVRGYTTHGVELREPLGPRGGLRTWARVRRRREDDFFGLGPDSRENDEVEYAQSSRDAGLALSWTPSGAKLVLSGDWIDRDAVEAGADLDSLPAGAFEGIAGADGSELASVGVQLTVPAALHRGGKGPEAGAKADVRKWFDTAGGDFGFTRWAVTLHGAVPVFWGDRVLAARLQASSIDPQSDREIPFHLLNALDGATGLRGFDTFRFLDRDFALMNVEYRFPIWDIGVPSGAAMDAVLFWDAGIVSSRLEDDLAADNVETDAGFGFRVRTRAATVARVNVAFRAADDFRIEYKLGRDF